MITQRVGPTSPSSPEGSTSAELHGGWLASARAAWVFIVLLTFVLFVAALPGYYSVLHDACDVGPCIGGQPSPGDLRAMQDVGFPVGFYAAYVLALDLLVAVVFCSVGAVIFWRRSRERAALFASFALVMFGLTWPGAFEALRGFGAWGDHVGAFLFELGLASLIVLLLVFPDGRFVPRWTRWVAAFAVVVVVSSALFPGSFLADPPQAINIPAFVGLWAICSFA